MGTNPSDEFPLLFLYPLYRLPPFSCLGGINSLNVSELFPLQGDSRDVAGNVPTTK